MTKNNRRQTGIQGIAILFFSLFLSITASAQIINGIVLDKKTKEALPFVHIGIVNEDKGVISDDEGKFKIDLENVSKEEKIVFSIIGYESIATPINEIKGKIIYFIRMEKGIKKANPIPEIPASINGRLMKDLQ